MTTCTEMLDKLERIDVDLLMQVAMEETANVAVREQKEQLQRGQRSDDTFLPDYSPVSVSRGKPAGPIRLYDKGDYYKGFLLEVRNDIFIMLSADSKSEMLQTKYGENIEGLGNEAKRDWIIELRPVFQKLINAELL